MALVRRCSLLEAILSYDVEKELYSSCVGEECGGDVCDGGVEEADVFAIATIFKVMSRFR